MTSIYDFTFPSAVFIFNFIILLHLVKKFIGFMRCKGGANGGCVLVTGCDTGFGYEAAIQLSKRELFVYAGCLSEDGAERLQQQAFFNGRSFVMDVTKEEEIANAKKILESDDKGGLRAIVNNAGILEIGPIEWQSLADMKKTMDVNLWGVVSVTKAFIPMLKKTQGRIVNISSMAGRVLLLNGTSYSMSKYAVEAFSDGLRYEMQCWNISVSIIEPGMFKTDILSTSKLRGDWEKVWKQQSDDIQKEYGEEYYNYNMLLTEGLVSKLASPRLNNVVDAICHAVLSSSPKPRYRVGTDANSLWMLIATLPTNVGDFIVNLLAKPAKPAATLVT